MAARNYTQALPLATSVVVTEIARPYDGDAFAPELGPEWVETHREPRAAEKRPALRLRHLHPRRLNAAPPPHAARHLERQLPSNVRLPQVLEWLAANPVDVLALQELKITDDKFPTMAFGEAGYQSQWFGQKTYNGVALLGKTGR